MSNKEILGLLTLSLMKKGKKEVAEVLVSELLHILRSNYKVLPFLTLQNAINNIKPLIGFRNVRLRGSSYKIPFFLKEEEQIKRALNWLILSAKNSKNNLSTSLAKEIIQASQGQGDLIHKRNEMHKLGNQNKVFAHYRWF